jgi:hypothetical protein
VKEAVVGLKSLLIIDNEKKSGSQGLYILRRLVWLQCSRLAVRKR